MAQLWIEISTILEFELLGQMSKSFYRVYLSNQVSSRLSIFIETFSYLLSEFLYFESPSLPPTHHWVGDFHRLLWAWVKMIPIMARVVSLRHSAIRLNLTHRNLMMEHLQPNYQQINCIKGIKPNWVHQSFRLLSFLMLT